MLSYQTGKSTLVFYDVLFLICPPTLWHSKEIKRPTENRSVENGTLCAILNHYDLKRKEFKRFLIFPCVGENGFL